MGWFVFGRSGGVFFVLLLSTCMVLVCSKWNGKRYVSTGKSVCNEL